MNRKGGDRAGQRHEDKDQQSVVGAAAFRDRHDGQPVETCLVRHAHADQCIGHRRQCIDENAGQDAGDKAQRGQKEHRSERNIVGLLRIRRSRCARAPQEAHAEGFHKTGGGKRADSASNAPTAGTRNFRPQDGSCGLSRIA